MLWLAIKGHANCECLYVITAYSTCYNLFYNTRSLYYVSSTIVICIDSFEDVHLSSKYRDTSM